MGRSPGCGPDRGMCKQSTYDCLQRSGETQKIWLVSSQNNSSSVIRTRCIAAVPHTYYINGNSEQEKNITTSIELSFVKNTSHNVSTVRTGAENVPSAGAKNVPRAKNASCAELCWRRKWVARGQCNAKSMCISVCAIISIPQAFRLVAAPMAHIP